jgi:predicted alpha/beta hydrolase family esterase
MVQHATIAASQRPRYLLPGWQNSGPLHWQSLWEAALGAVRVEQADWEWPRRGDWMARLDEVLASNPRLAAQPAILIAHSLGCQLVAAWAAHSRHSGLVAAALLVAPPDTARADMPPQLSSWRAPVLARLPFPACVVASSDDAFCTLDRAAFFADAWGARLVNAGPRGHLNSDSRLGEWPEGRQVLADLEAQAAQA